MAERNVIEGLEDARWGAGTRENSVMGVLFYALNRAGELVSYPFLMGVSGAAFRVHMHQPNWCPSSPHANCGYPCVKTVYDGLRHRRRQISLPEDGEERAARARAEIRASIDRGVPVLHSHEEEALVVGYSDEGATVLLRPYAQRSAGYVEVPLAELASGWSTMGVLEDGEPPDRAAALRRSLALAVELAETPAYEDYASGFTALERWIEGLRDDRRFVDSEPTALRTSMIANGHVYYSLCDARTAACAYLGEIAPELDVVVARRAQAAAACYEELCGVLRERHPAELAPMPWHLGKRPWTADMRRTQAEVLERALRVERRAVDCLRA